MKNAYSNQSISIPFLLCLLTCMIRFGILYCSGPDFPMIVQPILKMFTVFETVILGLHFLFCKLHDMCAPWPQMGAQVDLPSSTRYVEGSLRFSRCTSMHYIIDWCRVVVAVSSPMWIDARSCMNVFGTRDCKNYRCSRGGMSDVAFRTALPICGLSC